MTVLDWILISVLVPTLTATCTGFGREFGKDLYQRVKACLTSRGTAQANAAHAPVEDRH